MKHEASLSLERSASVVILDIITVEYNTTVPTHIPGMGTTTLDAAVMWQVRLQARGCAFNLLHDGHL